MIEHAAKVLQVGAVLLRTSHIALARPIKAGHIGMFSKATDGSVQFIDSRSVQPSNVQAGSVEEQSHEHPAEPTPSGFVAIAELQGLSYKVVEIGSLRRACQELPEPEARNCE